MVFWGSLAEEINGEKRLIFGFNRPIKSVLNVRAVEMVQSQSFYSQLLILFSYSFKVNEISSGENSIFT